LSKKNQEQPAKEDGHQQGSQSASVARKKPRVEKTVNYTDVWNNGQSQHFIISSPKNSGNFYIIVCDQHGGFGPGPLGRAARHLQGASHGGMKNVGNGYIVENFGQRVIGCDATLVKANNVKFLDQWDKRGGRWPDQPETVEKPTRKPKPQPKATKEREEQVSAGEILVDITGQTDDDEERSHLSGEDEDGGSSSSDDADILARAPKPRKK
jgi:hypothetical protein